MTTFVPFVERNDNEGESWTFWLQVDGNEEELDDLSQLVESEEFYEIDLDLEITEGEVDTLVEYGGGGYMDYHHKVTGVLVFPKALVSEDPDWMVVNERLYKGGVRDLFH